MPDITTDSVNPSYTLKGCSVNENNISCPDLADEALYSVLATLQPFNNSRTSLSKEDLSIFSDVEYNPNFFERVTFRYENPRDFEPKIRGQTKTVSYVKELRALQKTVVRPPPPQKVRKRLDLSEPSDLLKSKLKQSVSMHNLFHSVPQRDYDNYHTIHSSSDLSCDYPVFKMGVARCSSYDACSATSSFAFRGSVEKLHRRGKFKSNKTKSDVKKEVIYKCCCGMTRCKATVPIQQYLETYFDKRVSDTKKMTHCGFGAALVFYYHPSSCCSRFEHDLFNNKVYVFVSL